VTGTHGRVKPRRALSLALLSAAVLSCGESGPEQSAVEGIWQLRTVNGQTLPATSAALQGPMMGGVLRLVPGTTWTEYCVDRGAGEPALLRHGGGFQDLGNGRGLVLYYASSGAGSIASDTLTVSGDKATLRFRQGAQVTDVLRFDRIAGADMPPSETPRACP
jgi:hypothetical protein